MFGDDDDEMGPTWHMEDIQAGSLFEETYQSVSASNLPPGTLHDTVEYGNKIVMPTSALDTLSRLNIMYPMMFRVTGDNKHQLSTFCGVLEFSAPEGVVYLPPWMFKTLKIRSGELVNLTNVALPVGTFVKIQPQSVDFLDITDPRAVLEHSLRNFATLTRGDCISLSYNKRIYELSVLEVKPDDGRGGISVLETDLQVEFAPPIGYQEPATRYQHHHRAEKSIASSLDVNGQLSALAVSSPSVVASSSSSFTPFSGGSQRLSNRPKIINNDEEKSIEGSTTTTTGSITSSFLNSPSSVVAPLNLPKGTLYFGGTVASKSALPYSSKVPEPINSNSNTAANFGIKGGESSSSNAKAKGEGSSSATPTATPPKFIAFTGQARKL